MKCNLLW